MSQTVTVVFCPYLGSSDAVPHLGIARIAQAVKHAGYPCRVLDANALVAREDREWFYRFSAQTNIGHDIPRISFLFGLPDLFWVEPFTPMFTHAKKFGIDLEPYLFPIPQRYLHLEQTIREMSVVWHHEMSVRDRMFYASKLKRLFVGGS